MPTWQYFNRPTNLSYHDLTLATTSKPANIRSLLGLGLKFIPIPGWTAPWSKLDSMTIQRLRRDMELKCFFAGTKSTFDGDMRMYIRSSWTPPPWVFPNEVKYRLNKLTEYVKLAFKKTRKKTENLMPHQSKALKSLQQSTDLLVVQCDKNLGPALIEYERYIRLVERDHLSDELSYQRMTSEEANEFAMDTVKAVMTWLTRHHHSATKMERQFIRMSINGNNSPHSIFYATMKVHKSPLKTRPIVSCSGSALENLGVWVDRKLQHFLPMFASYFKSSEILKEQLLALTLPPTAKLFSSDAVSMYTCIPTDHALHKITRFLRRHERHIKEELPYSAIIEGLGIIMRRCSFKFGDTFWRQLSGTAMGTPPAPPYATIYFGLHEQKFLQKHDRKLLFYRRFIDDVIGIWDTNEGETFDSNREWDAFLRDMDSAQGLVWETTIPSNKIDFMDLTLSIENGKIATTLYEKPSNKHLYIPPHSCHPPGMINGVVHGMVRRIMTLCTNKDDQHKRIKLFVRHLRARGYHREDIFPVVRAALEKIKTPPPTPVDENDDEEEEEKRVFLHLPFHPDNPPSRSVQREWKLRVSRPPFSRRLRSLKNHAGKPLNLDRLTVAYHRSHNLGNLLSYRDLERRSGPTVSSLID